MEILEMVPFPRDPLPTLLRNNYSYKVCSFVFDQVELLGEVEVIVKGENSLEIVSSGADFVMGTTIDISGITGSDEGGGEAGPGGWAGGDLDGKGRGPGGGLPGISPGVAAMVELEAVRPLVVVYLMVMV